MQYFLHAQPSETFHFILRAIHKPWAAPLGLPAMSNTEDRHERFRVTRRYVELSGKPGIPVSGELHYSRVPAHGGKSGSG